MSTPYINPASAWAGIDLNGNIGFSLIRRTKAACRKAINAQLKELGVELRWRDLERDGWQIVRVIITPDTRTDIAA